jgi:predicted nuclease of restriction endonuclease-like (RecB) superfamily
MELAMPSRSKNDKPVAQNHSEAIPAKEYKKFLDEIREKILGARLKAAASVNREVIGLYWYIGQQIIEKQKATTWGDGLINALSHDLRQSFPETRGFSPTNLKRMRMLAEFYPEIQFGAQAVPQLPWGHIQLLLFRIKEADAREWYAQQCLENGWSRPTLEKHVRNNLFLAQGCKENKATNFLSRLPSPQSQIAQDMIKNPYNFDFLGLHDEAHEREIEHASIQHITKFMLELGKGVRHEVVHKSCFH